ncbi:hypothetical protein CASFOL_013263 [Castilleja foliolosa]|uniref:F-box domain-containing protein n=1 Tax=Castilleja foliolosa TaxID=1961234 RepID=A0ABD3DJH9_9LAMI
MANNVLPEELMLCILSRLPVKTIIRFKSVCKSWYHLFSTPEFKKLHLNEPKKQFFIVHRHSKHRSEPKNQFSIFNIESGKKSPTILEYPFAHAQNIYSYTLGCYNGLVCICRGQEIVLWNPALKLSKTVPLKGYRHLKNVSLGFGYDAIGDDFKVVMIGTNIHGEGKNDTSVEIYSVNLDSWNTIDVGFQFGILAKRDLIVNGNPYWVARFDENEVLVCFDMLELVFKIVPLPPNYFNGYTGELVDWNGLDVYTNTVKETNSELVDWNGALGALIIDYEVEYRNISPVNTECSSRIECFRVWVFDDIEQIWRNVHTFGPIEMDKYRVLHYVKNEKILSFFLDKKLFVVDLETGYDTELFDGAHLSDLFEFYGYTESLAHINGMEKVVN